MIRAGSLFALRRFAQSQLTLSRAFDRLLPPFLNRDGVDDFVHRFYPKYLCRGMTVYDVGGGKRPLIHRTVRESLDLCYVGLDVSHSELDQAGEHAYDRTICADISDFNGHEDADLVLCLAVFEHVQDVATAFGSIASLLKPGGTAVLFAPSRNAVYARLNLLLPPHVVRRLLSIFRQGASEGFPAYYDRCTLGDFAELGALHGLHEIERRAYYVSRYLSIFFPAHFLWRAWILLFYLVRGDQAAETFSIAFRKPQSEPGGLSIAFAE